MSKINPKNVCYYRSAVKLLIENPPAEHHSDDTFVVVVSKLLFIIYFDVKNNQKVRERELFYFNGKSCLGISTKIKI